MVTESPRFSSTRASRMDPGGCSSMVWGVEAERGAWVAGVGGGRRVTYQPVEEGRRLDVGGVRVPAVEGV